MQAGPRDASRLIEEGDPAADSRAFRRCLGQYATGVAVVTNRFGERQSGMTINSFAAVSLDPPIVLWSIRLTSKMAPDFLEASHFGISVLSIDQVEVAQLFGAGKPDPFADAPWHAGRTGAPLIDGAIAHLECRRLQVYDGGDHHILLGQVEQFARFCGEPLLFSQGQYAASRSHPALPAPSPQVPSAEGLSEDFSFVKLLSAASLHMSASFEVQRRALGLTTESARILNRLLESPRSVDILERLTFLGRSATSDALADLIERGLVQAQHDDLLALTAQGRRTAEALAASAAQFAQEKTGAIAKHDIAAVRRVLQTLAMPGAA